MTAAWIYLAVAVLVELNNPRLKARGFLTRCRLSRNSQGF